MIAMTHTHTKIKSCIAYLHVRVKILSLLTVRGSSEGRILGLGSLLEWPDSNTNAEGKFGFVYLKKKEISQAFYSFTSDDTF